MLLLPRKAFMLPKNSAHCVDEAVAIQISLSKCLCPSLQQLVLNSAVGTELHLKQLHQFKWHLLESKALLFLFIFFFYTRVSESNLQLLYLYFSLFAREFTMFQSTCFLRSQIKWS